MEQDRTVTFLLGVKHTIRNSDVYVSVHAHNQGIPPAEVALTVEAWAKKFRQSLQEKRLGGTSF